MVLLMLLYSIRLLFPVIWMLEVSPCRSSRGGAGLGGMRLDLSSKPGMVVSRSVLVGLWLEESCGGPLPPLLVRGWFGGRLPL